jgi:hypothetical protein
MLEGNRDVGSSIGVREHRLSPSVGELGGERADPPAIVSL